MTRDEIMQMEAGREMDLLVAKKVMGWWRSKNTSGRLWYEPAGATGYWVDYPDPMSNFPAFKPSTDIAAAWQVVEKNPHYFSLNRSNDSGWAPAPFLDKMIWRCRFYAPQKFEATADTAPLAICRAALLAMLKE